MTRFTRHITPVTALIAAAVLLASGCGSSSKSSGAGTTVPASQPPIKIGLLTSLTGPLGPTLGPSEQGAQARIDLQNAEGGVNGRKLQLVVADDASSVTQDLTAAQDLVQNKGVFGVLCTTAYFAGATQYLHQQ